MAKLHMLAVRDRVADHFQNPFFTPNIPAALRAFGDEVNREDPSNFLNRHADDYELYCIGEFDPETAAVTMLERPRQLALAKDFKLKSNGAA